jgi:TetR/AcrR family transcriptional repressor of mexJK operon
MATQEDRERLNLSQPDVRPRGRPRAEDLAEIERRLLHAAFTEFVRHGYGGASMRRIAVAAKLSRTTLSARFTTKEALFRAIMRQHVESMSAAAYLRRSAKTDLSRGLKAYANRALAYSLEGDYLELNRLIYSASHQFPEIGEASREAQCAIEDRIACRDPRVPAEMFTMLLRGWHSSVLVAIRTVPIKERAAWVEEMVDCLVAGRQGW